MAIYALGAAEPSIHPTAFVHPDAVVIGHVTIGEASSVWPGAVLRGDYPTAITVGARSSVQDNAVLHCTEHLGTLVGDDCVIGHIVHLEGCTVADGALVGSGAVVLHRAVVGSGAFVGAGAVVPDDMDVPAAMLALGVPAKVRDGGDRRADITSGAGEYVAKAERYRRELRRVD